MAKDLDGKKCASDWPNNCVDSVPNRINPRNLIGEKLEQEENSRNDNDHWLAKSAQRTPVNTEAKLLLLTHAFETWKLVRVEFITDVRNEQSRAAILRLGAKQEGILRKHLILPSGRVRDSVVFSITDDEWPEVKAQLENRLRY